jgi:hypothetical protein
MSLQQHNVPDLPAHGGRKLSSSLRSCIFDIAISLIVRVVALIAFSAITVSAIASELNQRANPKSRVEISTSKSDTP